MASWDGESDPEWRLEGVSWDADTMEASTKDTSSGGLGGPSGTGRTPNTSCQVGANARAASALGFGRHQ